MDKIVNLESLSPCKIRTDEWIVIIPAAGIGSRLGYNLPKILYPLLGRPLLSWLLDLFLPIADTVVLVLSPAGKSLVEDELRQNSAISHHKIVIKVQQQPSGMADAVLLCEDVASTPNVALVWGDQVLLRHQTVNACACLHQQSDSIHLTLPTLLKHDPYIHFVRDDQLHMVGVLQAREGEISVSRGENDCGLFMFNSARLFEVLKDARQHGLGVGDDTGEFNLLPLLPLFEKVGSDFVVTLRITDPDEALGINTPEEAEYAGQILESRQAG